MMDARTRKTVLSYDYYRDVETKSFKRIRLRGFELYRDEDVESDIDEILPIGYVYLVVKKRKLIISIKVDADFQEFGYEKEALLLIVRTFSKGRTTIAWVSPEKVRLFESFGFRRVRAGDKGNILMKREDF